MKNQEARVVAEFGKFTQAFWLELPMAATSRLLGNGDEDGVRNAGWKAYDAFVSLANEAANILYSNPLIGAFTGRTIEQTLRFQQMGRAATSGMLSNLWSTLGLPTVDEIASLRNELKTLHDELSQALVSGAESRPGLSSPHRQHLNALNRPHRSAEDDQDAAA